MNVEISQKDKSQGEMFNRIWTEEFAAHKYNFDRQKERLEVLPTITINEFKEYFEQLFVANTHKRLDICYNSKAHTDQEAAESKKVTARARNYTNAQTLKNTVNLFSDPFHESYVNSFKTRQNAKVPAKERSFIMIKPDGVQRSQIGKIVKTFEQRGFKMVGMKMCSPGKAHFEKHYSDLSSKGFFKGLIDYAASGPVMAMVWEGDNVVATGRRLLGATKPFDSNPATLRGDLCIDVGRNIIHGSDSVESANKEIALWFATEELNDWGSHSQGWLYE